jgi:hypothetical protein
MSSESRCGYEKCEYCPLFEFCETCYDEVCFYEKCNGFCGRCQVTCHSNPDKEFEKVNLHELKIIKPIKPVSLDPCWFPTVRKNKNLEGINLKCVAIKFEEIFNLKSTTLRTLDLHDYLSLPDETKIILTFNVPDEILEKIWLTFKNDTFKLIFRGFKTDYICTPNFSNYFDTPRYQYWRNIWRSVVMTNHLLDLGHELIFDVSSPVLATHKFYIDLIQKSNIKALAFNCQTIKLQRYREFAYERFKLFNILPNDCSFFITGLCGSKESLPVYETCKERSLFFTSSSPYLKAVCQKSLDGRGNVIIGQNQLFSAYFKFFEDIHIKNKGSTKN